MSDQVEAAVLIIGNEILSGRTKDANLGWLAERLNLQGIAVAEARIVQDIEQDIIAALNALRQRYRYVFTTGGIGPTHDDITTLSVARAFGVPLVRRAEAVASLQQLVGAENMNEARLRMADMPEGAELIGLGVVGAPGFRLENVYVMAGIPDIMRAMFESLANELEGNVPLLSETIPTQCREGDIAEALNAVQERFADVSIGSYPHFKGGLPGVNIVLRHSDADRLAQAVQAVKAVI